MALKPSVDIVNFYVTQYGYFYGMRRLFAEFDITEEQAIRLRTTLSKHILTKIQEAKQEIARLQTAVTRLENACQANAVPLRKGSSFDAIANPGMLFAAMQPFDGWVISLLESNISLLATIHNPETAGDRVNSLKDSFRQLWASRYSPNAAGKAFRPFDHLSGIWDLSTTGD